MANTITIFSGLAWTDGKDTVKDVGQTTVTQSGSNVIFNVQDIGTSAEALTLGDVVPGYILFKNLIPPPASGLSQAEKDSYNTSNLIKVSNDNAAATVVAALYPGQAVTIPTTQTTWYGKATTAGPLLVFAVDA